MTRRFKPPVYAITKKAATGAAATGKTTRWVVNLGTDEREIVNRMLAELRDLLATDDDATVHSSPLLQRLFPPAFLDDPENEAEYQRLMREELVTSRIVQIDAVTRILSGDPRDELDEGQIVALMQSVNAVRVVLGTMLDVGEDDDIDHEPDDPAATAEHQLYGYLSWLLDWTVRSLSDR